jgi:hypothetical protein
MAIARANGGDFCISFSLQLMYRGSVSTSQTSKNFMAGVAFFDSKMNKIYESETGIKCDGYPGSFQTIPAPRILNVPLNAVINNLRVGFSNGVLTFYNGESAQIHEQSLNKGGSVSYVALIMRGEGYYRSIFTNVKCAGLTAMTSSPTPSPTPNNEYLHLPNVSTDAADLGSGGEVDTVADCEKLCNDTEKCTGFDIVTSTNFCTLRQMVDTLPENDVYTNVDFSLPSTNAIESNLIDSINILINEFEKAKSYITKMKTATNGTWSVANDAYTNITNLIQILENIKSNNERPSTSVWNSSFTSTINLLVDAIQPVDYSVPFGSAAAGWVGSVYTPDTASDNMGLDAQSDLDNFLEGNTLNTMNTDLEHNIFPFINLVGQGPRSIQTITFLLQYNLPIYDIDSLDKYMVVCNNTSYIKIYSTSSLQLVSSIYSGSATKNILYTMFDNQNNIIYSTDTDGIFIINRNIEDGTYHNTSVRINATNNVTKMVMDSSGEFMVTRIGSNKNVKVLRLQPDKSYNQVYMLPTTDNYDNTCTISKNNKYIAVSIVSILYITIVKIFNRVNENLIDTVQINSGECVELIFDPSEKVDDVLFVCTTKKIVVYKKISSKFVKQYDIRLPFNAVHMSFDPTGIYLAVACEGGYLYVLRKQGNKEFVFTKSFNTTLELSYSYSSSFDYIDRNAFVKFNPKNRDLYISTTSSNAVGGGGGILKIFKKLRSEEPTRFQSPSPQGVDTYIKIEDNIFEHIYVKLKFTRTNTRGGGLKDVLKSIQFPPQSPPALTLPPMPRLDIDTLVIDFASGNPEFFIIDEDKQTTYSGTVSYNAITYPDFTETPVLAFAISIDTDLSGVYDTFYILTNTINFKSYTIINDKGEDVINLPDNQSVSIDKLPILADRNIFPANVIWYRQNVVQEIMLLETHGNTPDSISYNSAIKRLMFNTTPIVCDIYPGNHKVTFKTNSNTVSVSSPVVPIDTTIAVFFIHDENTIFLTYVHPSYYTIFNIKTNQYVVKIETNIAFTKNNQIDCPFYYIPTSLNLPSNSYLELDKGVMSLLNTIETNLSLAGGGNAIEVFPDDITTITIQKFKPSTSTRSIKIFNNGTLMINDNTISPIRFFVYNGIIIFRDKYGTVYSIVADSTYTPKFTQIKMYILSNIDTGYNMEITYKSNLANMRPNRNYIYSRDSSKYLTINDTLTQITITGGITGTVTYLATSTTTAGSGSVPGVYTISKFQDVYYSDMSNNHTIAVLNMPGLSGVSIHYYGSTNTFILDNNGDQHIFTTQ